TLLKKLGGLIEVCLSRHWSFSDQLDDGDEQIEGNVFKKLEKRKVLSKFEKAGLLSKVKEL
ncbi:hypothetical protein J1N35_043665, partial [Gossypium stocksii]